MARKWNAFLRVLRSYSIEEKVVSLVLVVVVFVLLFQSLFDIFRTPGIFDNDGGTYTEGLISETPLILNPVYVDFSEANREISGLIFSGLTKYDPDLQAFVGDLVELSISEDGKTYNFVLQDDVMWHDGELLTADDVYFTYHDVIQDPDFQNPVIKANFEGVEVKKIDDHTIEFVLDKPNSFFITNLNVGILPKHLLEGIPVLDLPQNAYNLQPVGSGPYTVDEPVEMLDDGRQRVFLALNDDYYGDVSSISNIRFHIYPDIFGLLKEQSTVNIIDKVPMDILPQIEESGRFEFLNYELPQYTAVFINMDNKILKKNKVRVALQKAIDKNELTKILSNKTLVDTPLMELDQSEWLFKPNIEEANGALFDSGYKVDENSENPYRKVSDEENLKFVLLVRQFNEGTFAAEEMKKVVDFLVESWEQIGVEIEAQYAYPDEFAARIQNRDYDLLLTGQSLGYNLDTYSYWHSSQADGNGLNLSNYKSFAADSLIETTRKTFVNENKEEFLKDLAKEIKEDVPAIFLYRPSYVFATDWKVENIEMENLAYPSDRFVNIADWCIMCEE